MRMRLASVMLLVPLVFLSSPVTVRAEEPSHFPLKDGDVWVMVGDSITAQHLHSNYFEAFCYARYPKLKFAFRNSGVGGDTIPKAIARYDWDTAAWKPTVVSVELGMNDQGGFTVEKYMENMKTFTGKVKSVSARPVYLSPSPMNNGDTAAKLGGNTKLHQFTESLQKYAAEEKASFADQFHLVIDVWGKNKPNEILLNNLKTVEAMTANDKLEGVEHLRAFLAVHEKSKAKLVSMQGDAVHPGPPGQLMMAAALLRDLGADGFVSSATLKASGQVVEAKGCKINDVKVMEDGQRSFERLDQALPFPIPDEARAVLPLFPTILELSQYTLKITSLQGKYDLKVNGVVIGSVTADELEKGVNLTTFAKGPIAEQGKQILAAVSAKEGLVGAWRNLSKTATAADASPEAKLQLAALTKKVETADAKIRAAATPKTLKFELIPTGGGTEVRTLEKDEVTGSNSARCHAGRDRYSPLQTG